MQEGELLRFIQARVLSGELPRLEGKCWGGQSSGRDCCACARPIGAGEAEIEVLDAGLSWGFHPRCHALFSALAAAG